MAIIPMYPPIQVTRHQNDEYLIERASKQVTLIEEADMFFGNTSLRTLLSNEVDHVFTIDHNHQLYKYCNALVVDAVITRYVIYDCEFDRWLCIADDGEVEWTTQYDDEDIAFFETEEDAENMIFDEPDGYAVQIRHYMKE